MYLFDRYFSSDISLLEKGLDYLYGLHDTDVSYSSAFYYLNLSAEKGNRNAYKLLYEYFNSVSGTIKEESKQLVEFMGALNRAVEEGDPQSCYLYGVSKLNKENDDWLFYKGL